MRTKDYNIRKINQSLQSQVGRLDKIAVLSKTNQRELMM